MGDLLDEYRYEIAVAKQRGDIPEGASKEEILQLVSLVDISQQIADMKSQFIARVDPTHDSEAMWAAMLVEMAIRSAKTTEDGDAIIQKLHNMFHKDVK